MMPPAKINDFAGEVQKAIDNGNSAIFIANSLDELAAKTGINAAGLKKQVEEYNQVCETGRDDLFHKRTLYLKAVKEPPFYAGKAVPGGYGSLGGIKINHRTEVVPGLYAAGVDANAIFADSYIFILPGNTMGFALNSGRMAGENAVKYIKG
jgi:fumarate reductase flavoprotein subunit